MNRPFFSVNLKRDWLLILFLTLFAIVLPGMLCPSLPPRQIAARTRCISNIKQLALSATMYTADYDDRFPLRDNWMDSTKEYRKGDDMLRCPTFAFDEKAPKNLYGYAMNQAISGAKPPPNIANVPLIFDSVNLARNASGTLDSLPNPGRHGGQNVIGYADGHAKAVDPNKP
jgi:prepilin-type processing-associated H-X9-DG protein